MKDRRKSRLAKLFSLPVLALCGFLIAGTLAGVGLATETTSTDSSTISTTTEPTTTTTPPGNEGCTPGFWKNNANKKGGVAWAATGFNPDMTVGLVFSDAPAEIASLTLLEGLELGGGGIKALTRHAIAAVLNAGHLGVDYPLTVAEIVDMVNDAYASNDPDLIESVKDTLDAYNNLGCPISQHNT